jgi:hypothetical protein
MTTAVQHRRGTTAEHSTFTGLEGEVTIDTTKDTAVIHDGTLAGGYPLAKENLANVTTSGLSSIDGASTASDDKFFIYDQSATTLKTITRAELNNAIEQDALANVAITGGTINGTAIGGTTAAAGAFTTLAASSTVTLSGGTANGVAYLNGSKVVTSGSALQFDGTYLYVAGAQGLGSTQGIVQVVGSYLAYGDSVGLRLLNSGLNGGGSVNTVAGANGGIALSGDAGPIKFLAGGSEQMRLTSTGLGIGTSSPAKRLDVRQAYTADTVVAQIGNTNNGNGATPVATIFDFTEANGTPVSRISSIYTQSTGKTDLAFGTYNSGLAEKMRLDSAGNLGLGVTPSAWNSARRVMQVGGSTSVQSTANNSFFSNNYYTDAGGTDRYINTSVGQIYAQLAAGGHAWYNAPSGTAGNAITFTQAMTLNASGQLGVGTTTPDSQITINGTSSSRFNMRAADTRYATLYADSGVFAIASITAIPLVFGINDVEKMRLDASGALLIGATSFTGSTNNNSVQIGAGSNTGTVWINHTTGTTSGSRYVNFALAGTEIGSITQSGTTAVLYNVTSDQRLKENITDADSASTLIDALQVRQFDWKADGSHQRYGFVAQELVNVAAEAVHQPEDTDEMMAVDYSKLVPMLVKEIQSLRKRLADAGI